MQERELKEFLDMMAAEKGASVNTIDAYRRDISQFLEFWKKDCALAEEEDIAAFVRDLGSRDLPLKAWRANFPQYGNFISFYIPKGT